MKIVWTKTSELTLDEIIEYIKNEFGNLVAEKYYFDVVKTVDDIGINPELFPIYQHKAKVRKAVINKKTILYYQIQEENINLLAFYDVRRGIHKL
ncbi:type II toxin-antitoxin system RelE/ParE family toxin [Flavobacterium undicola]|uniref:type II toxin-antitoxin system RelE/ParE family toxin n=1 Tax=Flavobacterium undicola TaxID=1932779 RepID=UPI0013784193|nr:type II toxin-antitoxin system RelE/ParE family toxin [Flavobacterium undicola]MBA0882602.1 type II toxin-antitoxin system RelE/ParE family toxin [Flavobacterium undicola]